MIPWPGNAVSPAEQPGPLTVLGNTPGGAVVAWIATARDRTSIPGEAGSINEPATRTAQTCFMRGLKETIEFTTNSPHSWKWRRICFTYKGTDMFTDSDGVEQKLYLESSAGYARFMAQLNITGSTPNTSIRDNLVDALFKGRINRDWLDGYTAKVDTQRVTIKADIRRIFKSGNDRGSTFFHNVWHPMNKNLVYEDDEDGGTEDVSPYSTDGKPGMGDYYVVDFIQAADGASASDAIAFKPQATLYWHEK